MASAEELEERVHRLETVYDEVLKERLGGIDARLDRIETRMDRLDARMERFEERMTALYSQMESNKTELIERIESTKTELIERIEKGRTELVMWMVGLLLGYLTANIAAVWAILTFAVGK